MERRNFLRNSAATIAAVIFPLGASAYASPIQAPVSLPSGFPISFLNDHKFSFTIISAPTQEKVDAGIMELVAHRAQSGRSVSIYADQSLSDKISALSDPKSELWVARNDTFPWLNKDHPIHENPELRLWARLRDDPHTVAIQNFADGCRFPRSGRSADPSDILAESFLTGHSVITGIVAPDVDAVVTTFVSSVTDYHYRDDLDQVRLMHNGANRSQDFRTRLHTAWA